MRFDGDAQVRQLRYTGRHRKGHGQVLAFRARGREAQALTVPEPTMAEPTVPEPTVAEPTVAEPTVAEPTVAEPTVAEPTVAEPTVADADQPSASACASRAS